MSDLVIFGIALCCTIVICRLIQEFSLHCALKREHKFYSTEVFGEKGKRSPYTLKRVMHDESSTWGYTVLKDGKTMDSGGYYQVLNIERARALVHELEANDGYDKTKF